jgi:hypothetical protein
VLGAFLQWEAIEQDMRNNAWSEARDGIATVVIDILPHARDAGYLYWNGRGRHVRGADGTEGGNTAPLDLAQVANLALGHVWRRLFDRVACALALNEDDWVTRRTATNDQEGDAKLLPFFELSVPGKLLKLLLIRSRNVQLNLYIVV